MDAAEIFSVIQKGLQLLPVIVEAGENIAPVVKDLVALAQGGKDGTVTDAQLTQLEATLDSLIESFNEPIE